MSGGSWDYAYSKLSNVVDRLKEEKSPIRRAFGYHLEKCAKALHDIEWVDSSDYDEGDEIEAIKIVLGEKLIVSICCKAEVKPTSELGEDGILHWDVICPVCGKSCEYEEKGRDY